MTVMLVNLWKGIKKIHWRWKVLIALFVAFVIVYWQSLPQNLFSDPYSTVLTSSGRELLSATIADDGQWRFPQSDSVSIKFAEALITFEDKRFRQHPGFDPMSLARALRQNIAAGKIVSGGSTISMQVIRLARKGKRRTVVEKFIEVVLATRLELRYSKEQILAMYASHAPFGGNVVGLDAACWRYFGFDQKNLSWAEAALLAVLPNAPSLIHPGKNRIILKEKRDFLLRKLKSAGKIDDFTLQLALEEGIPEQPKTLPRLARHLLIRMANDGHQGQTVVSTINKQLQERLDQVIADHHERLGNNQIHNAAAIIVEVNSGNILAYAGNIPTINPEHQSEVDIISAPRSTGSILKPFLYAAMLEEGQILPGTLLPDVPLVINGFAPQNFTKQYDGAVHADQALIRSLNVPAVEMLKSFRYEKFHALLRKIGMTTLTQQPDHYGLSIILGGAEATLFDVTGMYASSARTLNRYFQHAGKNRYLKSDFHKPRYIDQPDSVDFSALEETSWLNASSLYLTFNALKELYRPGEESGWKHFSSSKQIAWKTGTSFGLRDGWAVGVTPEYAVGVWVGNADGEGRPGLTGTEAASPLMFDIFSLLPATSWFQQPFPEMQSAKICKLSGHRVSAYCEEQSITWIQKTGLESPACPYHKPIHLTSDLRFRLHSDCAPLQTMKHVSWFVLPPVQEFYYRSRNLSFKSLPPFRKDCEQASSLAVMDLIYPKANTKLFIPRDIAGNIGSSVFELAHRNTSTTVYWHLDGQYLGATKKTHHFPINASAGKHVVTLVDEQGQSLERSFEVISTLTH
jgi:penicillin-binding protein 1C